MSIFETLKSIGFFGNGNRVALAKGTVGEVCVDVSRYYQKTNIFTCWAFAGCFCSPSSPLNQMLRFAIFEIVFPHLVKKLLEVFRICFYIEQG